jgi:hypothetical protein
MPRYEYVSGALFAVIALGQLTRAMLGLPVQIGTVGIPVWVSFIAFAISAGLAIWGFRTPGTSSART